MIYIGLCKKILSIGIFAITISFVISIADNHIHKKQTLASQTFAGRYAEEALSPAEMPKMVSSHPRLLLRNTPWNRGPNVMALRLSAQEEPLNSYLKKDPWNPKPGLEWAFRYLLTRDEKLVAPIVEIMKKQEGYWPGYLTNLALLYDWVYNSPSFSIQDKKIVEDKMVGWAENAIGYGERYSDMWSHFGYRPPVDIAAAGLALHGHREEAKKYIAMGGGYIKKNMFPGWKLNDGAWQGGWVYYGDVSNLFRFVAIWSSATEEDLYDKIGKEQSNWLRDHLYYMISTVYPDGTPFDSSGFSYSPYRPGDVFPILSLTRGLNDKDGMIALRKMGLDSTQWWAGIDQFMYYTPQMRKLTLNKESLPLAKCWGKEGVGYVQMRSGWKKDDTIIEFKCGDYFWSHQFQNQNSFTIYRKGRLAIQSGLYDAYFGNHMQFYYRPTVGSNSILVIQPDEVSWIPPGVAKENKIPNRNGYISEWGGQRVCYLLPEYGSAENCFTFNKYLYRKDHEHNFETGDIKAFEATDRYSYVFGDATKAYNNPTFTYPGNKPKLDLFTRQLVFIDKKYLVIFDRVNSLNHEYEKKWLLHSIGEPRFIGNPIQVEYAGHQEIYNGGLVRIDNQEGTLYCQTLFSEDYLIKKVGGSARVTAAKMDSGNKGNAVLETSVKGKYQRVSPTIASDTARKEDWTIEFIDAQTFKIRGTITEDDGNGSLKDEAFISNSQSIFILKENWKGTPERGDKFYFSVTSPSHRFWVNGKNQPPTVKTLYNIIKDGSHIDPGSWRIEVFPKKKEKFDTFLHLLYPCDRDTPNPPLAEGVVTSDNMMKGVSVDNWMVFFGNKGIINQKTEYVIRNKGETINLLLDMKPEKPYMINIQGSSGSKKQKIIASKEGTIFFTSSGLCRVEITPL